MPFTRDQIVDVKHIIKETIYELFVDDTFLSGICDKVLQKLNIKEIQDKVLKLEAACKELEKNNKQLTRELEHLQQHKKRKSVRIYGIKEVNQEDVRDTVLKIFKEKLKIELLPDDIKNSFRMGKHAKGKRPILVTVNKTELIGQILRNRKNLKGTSIVIQEDMTSSKYKLYKEALENFSKQNVWYYRGNIYVKIDNTKYRINSPDDILSLKQ